MNKNLSEILYAVPPEAQNYAGSVFDLDPADIPVDRIPTIREVMLTSKNGYDTIMAARVLTSWGIDDGFDFLENYVCTQEPNSENLMPHRLRGYDDTLSQILGAMVSYWATKATYSELDGANARARLKKSVCRIVEMSGFMAFDINRIFWLVRDEGFTEYISMLKTHLETIIKNPKFHHWKVSDCAHLLMKFDPDFVAQTLAAHGYTLADFPKK